MDYVKRKINRLGSAFVIFCSLSFGIFLCSVYSPAEWYFYAGLAFILAGGLGVIVSLFLTFHPKVSTDLIEQEVENNTDVTTVN